MMTEPEETIDRSQVPLEFSGGFSVNLIIWISALRTTEIATTEGMVADLKIVLQDLGPRVEYIDTATSKEFLKCLRAVAENVKNGDRPILHLDMHGSKEDGLEIGATGEMVSWDDIVFELQEINKQSRNNLCVVSASCFGFHVIREINISESCPFYFLIAPEERVTIGFLTNHTVDFYRDVFMHSDIMAAFDTHLSERLSFFSADKMLFISVARYIHNYCRGEGAVQRREKLLLEILLTETDKTPEAVDSIREKIAHGITPAPELLHKYVEGFLLGKKPGFTFDDLINYVESAETRFIGTE